MNVFLCHQEEDTLLVGKINGILISLGLETYYYPTDQQTTEAYSASMQENAKVCDVMIVFLRSTPPTTPQIAEISSAWGAHQDRQKQWIFVWLEEDCAVALKSIDGINPGLHQFPRIKSSPDEDNRAECITKQIAFYLRIPWTKLGLPIDPEIFDYEKSIIVHLEKIEAIGEKFFENPPDGNIDGLKEARDRCERGAPSEWPSDPHVSMLPEWEAPSPVEKNPWARTDDKQSTAFDIGMARPLKSRVSTAATFGEGETGPSGKYSLPEAGPREDLYFPKGKKLTIGILVSGGIAPGINAVIDGIVQRHWLYAHAPGDGNKMKYNLVIRGFQNGFSNVHSNRLLAANIAHKNSYGTNNTPGQSASIITSDFAHEGGSMIGTSRVKEMTSTDQRNGPLEQIANDLTGGALNVDILYIIGGDGSMRAAHALSTVAKKISPNGRSPLSVVGVPKTMDNDILWVWQSFGFLSAVEKAKEVIENLYTEVSANPRLGVVQLFGSVSGFVVSHAVLASSTNHCELALIPEVPFSVEGVANHMRERMSANADGHQHKMPFGLIVMAETAIPSDVEKYLGRKPPGPNSVDPYWIGLSNEEEVELRAYLDNDRRVFGQTSDLLRSAGLKLMSVGLANLLKQTNGEDMEWANLRYLTNEPRHILRAVPPSSADIINCQRLGILAVDNAMGGFTDFMISQWLTEFVIVPLSLVVLGRKKIYTPGIFWKSVIAKTEQHTTDLNAGSDS